MFLFVLLTGSSEPDDRELTRRTKRGDREAFGQLVRRHQKRIYALCYRFGGSHDFADDMTQEAFIKAYEAIGSYDERYPFAAWITRIATNNAINHLKRGKFQLSSEDSEKAIEIQRAPEHSSNPETCLSQKEINERYQQALDKLPPEFRVVFLLRMEENLGYNEIAEQLEINVGTVMSRLHRARQRLVEELKDVLKP